MSKEISRTAEEKTERKVGLFILISIITVIIVMVVIGKEKKLFKKKYQLVTTFDHGGNIDKNTGVTLAGLKIGNVTGISINDANKIDVVMSIQQEYQSLIKEDSVATLVFSLLKGSVIDLTFGSPKSWALEDGDYIPSTEAEEIADKVSVNVLMPQSDLIEDIVKNKLPSIIAKVDNVFGIIDNLVDRLGNSSSDLNRLIDNMEKFSNRLNESTIIEQSGLMFADIGELTSSFKSVTTGLPVLLKKVSMFLDESSVLLNNLKDISGNLKEKSPDLPVMIESAEELMGNLGEVIEATKKSFLLRKHFKKDGDEEQIMINEGIRDLLLDGSN